ncbi:hypothetical protein MHJ94_11965 [Chryseobacterium taklimakanense]|uniref:hypothetical protein n=1 Tax=Chryseobacterium taklimakanense TaxID=536441 RepID=UPI001EF70D0C|nr:hypothetical protein [Chryseobacterium taklimakanense]MCG7282004.1 hypothetical protein [Chryseobacterium taklimakanense]
MKKAILIIFSLFALLIIVLFIGTKQYSRKLDNTLFKKEEEINPVWKNLLHLTNMRMSVINDLYKKHNCDNNNHIKTIDSIILEKKSSEDYMKKNFHPLELKANTILLGLYNCKKANEIQIDSLLKPYNDSLNIKIKLYNSLVDDYNNDIFKFPNTFFIDYEKHKSKRFMRIDYSNNLENEVKKQSEIENWIETGELR